RSVHLLPRASSPTDLSTLSLHDALPIWIWTDNATLPPSWSNDVFGFNSQYAVRLTNARGAINPVTNSGSGNLLGNGIALQGNVQAHTSPHLNATHVPNTHAANSLNVQSP